MKNSPERVRRERLRRKASVNSDPSRGCEGKQRFATHGAAERVAKLSRKRKKTRFVVYPCRTCHGFHFGFAVKQQSVRRSFELRPGAFTEADGDELTDALSA